MLRKDSTNSCDSSSKILMQTCKYKLGARARARIGKCNLGTRPINANFQSGPANTNLGPGLVNTNLGLGPLNKNWGPGPVTTNLVPGLVNTNWGPGQGNTYWGQGKELGAKQRTKGRKIQRSVPKSYNHIALVNSKL